MPKGCRTRRQENQKEAILCLGCNKGLVARMTYYTLTDGVLPAMQFHYAQLRQPGWEAALASLSRMEHDSHDIDNGSCSAGMGACENACLWKRSFVPLREISGGKTRRKSN